jgi:hypothetical protein
MKYVKTNKDESKILLKHVRKSFPMVVDLSVNLSNKIYITLVLDPKDFCVLFFDPSIEKNFKLIIYTEICNFVKILFPEFNLDYQNILFHPILETSSLNKLINEFK